MATINYVADTNLDGGYVKVEWPNMATDDDGQPFDCAGLRLASAHYWGDFNQSLPGGGGKITLMACNQITPTDFGEFMFSFAPRVQIPVDNAYLPFVGAVKPVADNKFVSGGVALIFVKDSNV
jgi:hypothetical protein